MNPLYAVTLTADILAAQAEIAQINTPAAGVYLQQLLEEYAAADFVIMRSPCCDPRPFCISLNDLIEAENEIECEYCEQLCDRLLADGTWQTAAERQQLNLARVMR